MRPPAAGGCRRPQPRSHAGPWIKFSLTPFGLNGTVRDPISFVIFDTPISRLNNEPITARSRKYPCRSGEHFLCVSSRRNHHAIVTRITQIL
jgi:hypothetical protein